MNRVSAVIPTWNRRDLVANVLGHVARQSVPPQEVVVVDNGSTDGSAEEASRAGARVVRMGRNAGFAAAVNRGIEETSGEFVAVLNNDVEPAPDWLERLLAAVTDRDWFWTGKVLGKAGEIDGTFDLVSRGACAWRAGHGRPDGPAWSRGRPIVFPPFTAVLLRRELLARVGGLDERFESYLEDVEFGLRSARAGYGGRYVPEAVARHLGSATLGAWHPDTVRRISRNQLFLVARHFPETWPRRCGWSILAAQLLWGLLAASHGEAWSFLRGKSEAIRRWGELRGEGEAPLEGVFRILEESEREILSLQRETGLDLFWKVYFVLT